MGRYTGPKTRVSRRYGVPLFGPSKALERKNYPPGIHGPRGSRRKQSDYAIALGEKQKLRYQYGLLERQGYAHPNSRRDTADRERAAHRRALFTVICRSSNSSALS